jgi:hypothetical protein
MGQRARDLISAVVARGVAPLLKAVGFRKAGLRFHRPAGEVVQVIDFQLSQANFADTGEFFVNVALGVGRLWDLEGKPRPDRPRPHECQVCKRLEEVVPGAPSGWDVSASTNLDGLAERLSDSISSLLIDLDGITSIEALLRKGWLKVGADLITRAQLRYVSGDHEAALADLRVVAEFFSDRRGMSLAELIRRHGMTGLEHRIGGAGRLLH